MARRLSQLASIPVTELKGVGKKSADALARLEIHTVLDLLLHYPRRYLDRTKEAKLADLRVGDEAMVLVTVMHVSAPPRNRRAPVRVTVTDGEGRLQLTFFNQPWRARQLQAGMEAIVFGKLDTFRGKQQMTNPVVDLLGDKTGRIVPVYPQSEKAGVSTWELSRWMQEVLRRAGDFAEPLDDRFVERFELVDRTAAFRHIHAPESMKEVDDARRRLVFDELLRVQLELVRRKRELERSTPGIVHPTGGALLARFHATLPFELTAAQRRAIDEIEHDLALPHPMHRLLQGDVGSGKTLVAVSALLVAVEGGRQGALMAPTEVLAEQHFAAVRELLDDFTVVDEGGTLFAERPLRVGLLTNRVTGKERERLLADLADGQVDLLIGTHALIQDVVAFHSLGVVVIDEQHRFGVEQRATLREKAADGGVPDVLVMTATPIPRTAAMTVYGDLDVSVLDELPPGRRPVATTWARTEADEAAVWDQADKLPVASAEEPYARLCTGELAGLEVGLLHGRVSPREKEAAMAMFREGGLDVLVATTVIEVGVDVPNATVMVVLDADRFGIAQLHQLRGRVGRGEHQSACFLVGDATTTDGEERLQAMVRTTDGFELAEVDLDIRGEGTIMGERQKGRNDLRLASLRRDRAWVEIAREVAVEILDEDPTLEDHAVLLEEVELLLSEDDSEYLLKS
jgi:ATP-dependent DNA helicase RecG